MRLILASTMVVLSFGVVYSESGGVSCHCIGNYQSEETPGQQEQPELDEAARLNATVVRLSNEEKYEEALPLAKKVLELREGVLGQDHPLIALSLNNLAAIYVGMKKHKEAEPFLLRALTIFEKDLSKNSTAAADVVNRLAVVRFSRNDFKEAEKLLLRALDLQAKSVGPEHPSLMPVLLNLSDFYYYRGDREKAEQHLDRAFSILEKQPPRKDEALAQRLEKYLCPLVTVKRDELVKRVQKLTFRLKEPEKAAEQERLVKEYEERQARGEQVPGEEEVSGGILNGRAISKAAPSYPMEAKAARLSGSVVIQITVDDTGRVIETKPVCGHPVLAKAGEEAVRKWRFTPTYLAGKPVQVNGHIVVNFVVR